MVSRACYCGAFPLMLLTGILAAEDAKVLKPGAVFEQRIMPIFKSPNPSSCVQCHLSSVDLKQYIRPSSRETFLSLREQGLVSVKRPRDSKILHLIARGDSDPDALARRIHAKNRQAEYEAFAAWIEACCKDPDLRSAKLEAGVASEAGPSKPLSVIRHTRKDRLLDSFVRNVWSQRMRCFPCHTPHELDSGNPQHATPRMRQSELVEKFGAKVNLFKATPEATLRSLVASSRRTKGDDLPLINTNDPLQSLLLLKPTSKLPAKVSEKTFAPPSSAAPVTHMGGIKMHPDDQSYKAFAAWLTDYAKSAKGEYSAEDELPTDNWYPTQHVVRVMGIPAEWPNLSTVQVFIHRWDDAAQDWTPDPVAFTQGKVTPRKIVNGALFIIATPRQRESLKSEGATLAPGKVQLRLYVDRDNKLANEPSLFLNDGTPHASVSVEAKFQQGFKNADVVPAGQLQLAE